MVTSGGGAESPQDELRRSGHTGGASSQSDHLRKDTSRVAPVSCYCGE